MEDGERQDIMEILAKNLRIGHSLPNGSWGAYRITEIELKDGWVIATGQQGDSSSTHTFWLQADRPTWLA
jgi:hypothetical protein